MLIPPLILMVGLLSFLVIDLFTSELPEHQVLIPEQGKGNALHALVYAVPAGIFFWILAGYLLLI